MTTNDAPIAHIIEVKAIGATVPEATTRAKRLARNLHGRSCMTPWVRSIRPIVGTRSYRIVLAWPVIVR